MKRKQMFNQENIDIKEQFYTVYQNIELKLHERSPILMVTSITQLQSTSLSTAYLALAFSEQQKRVLLIDANLHHPSLHEVFKIKNSIGLGSLLLGGQNQSKVKPIQVANQLYCLPAEVSSYYPASLLRLESLREFIQAWREQFDVILFHTSDYLTEPDARIIASYCSGTILMIEEGHDQLAKIMDVKKSLESGNEIIGSIVIS